MNAALPTVPLQNEISEIPRQNIEDDLVLQNDVEDWPARQLELCVIIKLRVQELKGYSYQKNYLTLKSLVVRTTSDGNCGVVLSSDVTKTRTGLAAVTDSNLALRVSEKRPLEAFQFPKMMSPVFLGFNPHHISSFSGLKIFGFYDVFNLEFDSIIIIVVSFIFTYPFAVGMTVDGINEIFFPHEVNAIIMNASSVVFITKLILVFPAGSILRDGFSIEIRK